MWAVCLCALALCQCFLVLTVVAQSGRRPESLPSSGCGTANCTSKIRDGIQQQYEKSLKKKMLEMIKNRLAAGLRPNRTMSKSTVTPCFVRPTLTSLRNNCSLPPPFCQKAVKGIIEKMRKRYNQTARLNNYTSEVNEIIALSEEAASLRDDEFMVKLKADVNSGCDIQVLKANMYVLVRYKKTTKDRKNAVRRVKLRLLQLKDDNTSLPLLWTTLDVEVRHTRWQKLILPTFLIQNILSQAEPTVKFRITCQNCTGDIQPILIYKTSRRKNTNPDKDRKGKSRKSRKPRRQRKRRLHKRRPFVMVITRVKRKVKQTTRARRSVPPLQCLASLPRCQVKHFHVTFEQLGWDSWVISPKGFVANYCDGRCSSGTMSTRALVDDHSILSRLGGLRSTTPSPAIPSFQHRPCCVPTVWEALTLTYLNDDGIEVTTTVRGMKVRQCGCAWRSHQ